MLGRASGSPHPTLTPTPGARAVAVASQGLNESRHGTHLVTLGCGAGGPHPRPLEHACLLCPGLSSPVQTSPSIPKSGCDPGVTLRAELPLGNPRDWRAVLTLGGGDC